MQATAARVQAGSVRCQPKLLQPSRNVSLKRGLCVSVRAETETVTKQERQLQSSGYINQDNTGKGNVFPVQQAAYVKSSTADQVASQGLGGTVGAIVLLVAIGAVGAATVGLFGGQQQGGETLQQVANNFDGDSLTSIAARIKGSI